MTRHPSPTTIVLTVITGTVMIPIDITIVAVAIARLSQETGASLPVIQWVATGYTLALATVIPAAAWAISRFGARQVFLTAIGVFTIGSGLVAASWNVESLIAFRVLQGLGGGFVMPAAMTLTLRSAPPEQRGRLMALMGLPVLIGPVFGPMLGGWLLDTMSWRWMFLINLPLGIGGLLLGLRNLPRLTDGASTRLDRRGLLLLPPAMALLVLGTSFAEDTLLAPDVLIPIVAGVVLVALFVRHALRAPAPLLDIRLLRRRLTGGSAALLVCFAGGYFGSMILVPLYWQVVRGESATTAGLLMAPAGIAAGIMIQISGRLIDRFPPLPVVGSGIVVSTLAFGALALQLSADASMLALATTHAIATAGAGFVMLPTMTIATRYLEDSAIPAGSTMINVLNQLATALCTAGVSVLLAAALSTRLPGLAGDGIGALSSVTPAARAEVAPLAAEAMQAAFWLPVTMMAISALIALIVFRRTPSARATIESARPDQRSGRVGAS
ncbi:EmrB/QacA subfamily drug resistance transporter [Nocardioides albertanoniae]|uniref:EmrB/QacA subfamily drug resistance transporter n=1 Tax=Nocardioides albertanoniae TaxID=1175486 RepID=A0A543A2P8_9ACTN|nr:DHA2 family efflux MFS transporter permease subunit [Nocardioides albertanoniae]TQL66869.1 EmrB/QacA subfamily drug resistance transporter [Nocardioides albertanoniae]